MMTRLLSQLATVMLVATLVGCASIPTSGQVQRGPVETEPPGSTESFRPAPPAAGASPTEIAHGFLDAMLAYPVSSRVAAMYLTPEAADAWNPRTETRVYADPRAVEQGSSVQMRITTSSLLDSRGRWSAGPGEEVVDFDLERVDGQWRISNPPAGSLVTEGFFEDYVRPFNLYFIDRARGVLVPVPVHLVVGDQLPTRLMAALAQGPDDSVSATTVVPEPDALRPAVPVNPQGVADVSFSASSGRDTTSDRDMSAQIVWTLKQVLGVRAVRISVGGDVVSPGAGPNQPTTSWSGFGPDGTERRVVVLSDGEAFTMDGKRAERLRIDAAGASAAAMSTRIAVSRDHGIDVLGVGGTVIATLAGSGLLAPVVDRHEHVWAVSAGGLVSLFDGEVRDVATLPGRLDSFAVSPDASRYAVVRDGRVGIGQIIREAGAVTGLTPPRWLDTQTHEGTVVEWLDSTRVVHLSRLPGGELEAWATRIDSSSTILLQSGPSLDGVSIAGLVDLAVAGATTRSIYALDDAGDVWLLDGDAWALTSASGVTALS